MKDETNLNNWLSLLIGAIAASLWFYCFPIKAPFDWGISFLRAFT